MTLMVENGEADALMPERIWAEVSRGFASRHPLNMIDALSRCGLWTKLFPVDPDNSAMREVLSKAVSEDLCLDARFALMTAFCRNAEEAQQTAATFEPPSPCSSFAAASAPCFRSLPKQLMLRLQGLCLSAVMHFADLNAWPS